MPTIKTEITVKVNVEYIFFKGSPGIKNSLYVPEEPDIPVSVELESVESEEGDNITVTNEIAEQLEEYILENHQ